MGRRRVVRDLQRKFAIVLFVLGALGFLQPFWLRLVPDALLDWIEFPNAVGAVRLAAPNGRVFVASQPLGRVQRYGPDGFERGFFVAAQGGVFDLGVSPSGQVLICSVRARSVITYTQDGVEVGPRLPCAWSEANHGLMPAAAAYPNHAKVPDIAFSWYARLALPLWHPMLAWVMALLGGLYLKAHPKQQ
jgi:hypothetical protein